MASQLRLPPGVRPRLLMREAAAAYVSASPNKFDEMVEKKLMPPAKQVSEKRYAWDILELDVACDRLPARGEATPSDTWSDVDATQTAATR